MRTLPEDILSCEVCDQGLLPIDGKCQPKTPKCSEEDCEYCELIQDLEICSMCKKGYYLVIEKL